MQWNERDGPSVTAPLSTGFGRAVVVRMVEYALNGKVQLDYRTSGILWKVLAPLSRVEDRR